MFFRRRQKVAEDQRLSPPRRLSRPSDAARAGAIVLKARSTLQEFADFELRNRWPHPASIGAPAGDHTATNLVFRLGFFDGIGMLLKLSDYEVTSTGLLLPEELALFQAEGAMLIDVLLGSALNYMVLNSLLLTILVSLIVIHVGHNAYDVGTPALRLGEVGQPDGGAWADAATFFSSDSGTQQAIRRTFYALECGGVSVSTMLSVVGLWQAMLLYIAISSGLPSVISKFSFLVEKPSMVGSPGLICFGFALWSLFFALPFVAARASAIAFFCALAISLRFFGYDAWSFQWGYNAGAPPHNASSQRQVAWPSVAASAFNVGRVLLTANADPSRSLISLWHLTTSAFTSPSPAVPQADCSSHSTKRPSSSSRRRVRQTTVPVRRTSSRPRWWRWPPHDRKS